MNHTDNPRLLLVEDDYLLAEDLARGLARLGAEIVAFASTVEKAVALAESNQPIDGAVLDINLRDHLVYPAVRALRERGVSIVFATGQSAPIPDEFGDIPVLHKPVNAAQVLVALRA